MNHSTRLRYVLYAEENLSRFSLIDVFIVLLDDGVEEGRTAIVVATHKVTIDVAERTLEIGNDIYGGRIHLFGTGSDATAEEAVGNAGEGVAIAIAVGIAACQLELRLHLCSLGAGVAVVCIFHTGMAINPIPCLRHIAGVVGYDSIIGPILYDSTINHIAKKLLLLP